MKFKRERAQKVDVELARVEKEMQKHLKALGIVNRP